MMSDRSSVKIEVFSSQMLDASSLKRVGKAVERLYYLLLFSEPGRASTSDWESWLKVGTHLTVREAPDSVSVTERYSGSTHIWSRSTTIVSSGRSETVSELSEFIRSISGSQGALQKRLESSLGGNIRTDDREEFGRLLLDSVQVLTGPYIESVVVSETADDIERTPA